MLELAIAIAAMVIWEVGRRLALFIYRWHTGRNALRRVLSFSGTVAVSQSTGKIGGQSFFRESDIRIERMITAYAKTRILENHDQFAIENPVSDLVVIGSPRYNEKAVIVQQYFDLPYQFVFADDNQKPEDCRLSIITEFGEELTASPDYLGAPRKIEVDYGILLIARLAHGKRLLWLGGIHGIGTLGVLDHLLSEAPNIARNLPTKVDTATVRLLRITYEPASTRDHSMITSVELLGQTRSVGKREVQQCNSIVCDLGNVLMDFDRNRTYRAVAHHLKRDLDEVRRAIESSGLLQKYELGEVTTIDFCEKLRECLEASAADLPDALISEYWGDIFWESPAISAALTFLQRSNVILVLLSNTNELHFRHVADDYPDLISLFKACILSYNERMAKPNPDMFRRALDEIRKFNPDIEFGQVIFVDDKPEYVQAAERIGMKAFVYRSYPHFVFWLRKHGLYVS